MTSIGKLFKRLLLVALLLIVAFHVLVAGLLLMWKTQPIDNSMFMLTHRLKGGSVTQQWADYDAIAKSAKQAAIVSEDSKFSQHKGFDLDGIEAARKKNEASGSMSAGGSTITQQLAKNLFLTSHRSYTRKAEEAIITVMIETLWDKQRILTAYLNAATLNRDESALLIAMLPNPKYYGKNKGDKRLRNKQRIIKRRMNNAVLPQAV